MGRGLANRAGGLGLRGSAASNSTRTELGEMARSSRTITRNTERELQGVVAKSEQGKEEVVMRKREMASKEGQVARLAEETIKFKEQVDREEVQYNSQLASIGEQLHQLKSQDRVNMEKIEREYIVAKDTLERLQLKRKVDKEAGQEFLRKVADKTVSYMEECTGYRDNAARAVMEAAREKVEMVRKAGVEIQDKVEKALKETDRG